MDKKIKLALALSLLGFGTVACAPNPYWQYPGSGSYNSTAKPAQTGVTHTHCGRTHTHVLPAQGLAHHHGDGCMAGEPNKNVYRPPVNNTYRPPANTNTYPYNPPANNNAYNGNGYIDYTGYSTPKANYPDYSYNYNNSYPANTNTSYTPTAPTPSSSPAPASGVSYNAYNGGDTYVVQKGDTVFQVMRNTGVYWKDLIRLNNLQAPDYTINVGQALRLK